MCTVKRTKRWRRRREKKKRRGKSVTCEFSKICDIRKELVACTCAYSPQIPSHLFFEYNDQLGPPFHILVDTNFINFSIQNKLDVVQSMMDCLYAKCKLVHVMVPQYTALPGNFREMELEDNELGLTAVYEYFSIKIWAHPPIHLIMECKQSVKVSYRSTIVFSLE